MKQSQSKLKSQVWSKNCENKTENEWIWNIFLSNNSRLQVV